MNKKYNKKKLKLPKRKKLWNISSCKFMFGGVLMNDINVKARLHETYKIKLDLKILFSLYLSNLTIYKSQLK